MAMPAQMQQPVKGFPLDPWIATAALLLLIIGLVMVASASSEIAARTYGNSSHLLIRHLVYILISLVIATLALMTPIRLWQKLDVVLLLASFALLIVVLIPGLGHKVNGSTRWISFGFFTLQGSEFVKLFVIVYISGYLVRRHDEVQTTIQGFVKPIALVSLMVLLLLEQPDFGAAIVIMASVMGVIFLA
ncbi:MAG: cell division protein FtsW, partial [Candidatus Paceibacteria bacterium]